MLDECAVCGNGAMKVIYFGLPGRLCEDIGCGSLTGLASYVPESVQQFASGEDGFCFMSYEGGYWPALWQWLKG